MKDRTGLKLPLAIKGGCHEEYNLTCSNQLNGEVAGGGGGGSKNPTIPGE